MMRDGPRPQNLTTLVLMCLLTPATSKSLDSELFAEALEQCIRDHAAAAVRTFSEWANGCMPPTEKIDRQARVYEETLVPIQKKYGYTAALWCSFYSLRMTGAE